MARAYLGLKPRSQLVNMSWDEISGVDAPANEEPNWLVLKSAITGGKDDDARDLAEELREINLDSCPPEIQGSAKLIMTWLAQEGYDGHQHVGAEEPDEETSEQLAATDFSTAPPNVRAAARALAAYLVDDSSDDNDDPKMSLGQVNTHPPVGIQLYGGSHTNESRGVYGIRPGRGSQSFTNSPGSALYGVGKASRMSKENGVPSARKLVKMLKAASFYGNTPDNSSFYTAGGGSNGYSTSSSPSQFPSSDSAPRGAFYDNWNDTSPYTSTGDDGVGDAELADALDDVAQVSEDFIRERYEAAFDQFLEASWPGFAKQFASIVNSYSDDTNPYDVNYGGSASTPPGSQINKSKDKMHEEISELVEDLKKSVMGAMEIYKRDFSDAQRKKLAASGAAMSGGGFPIANVSDLKNAIRAIGRAKNRAAAIAHIKKRARALGATKLLPDSWSK